MAVTITLSTSDGQVVAMHDGRPLADAVALDSLPRITADSNPYRLDPAGLGARLYAALGGPALSDLLDADDEGLLLAADDAAAGAPWEYAATPDGDFLVCRHRFLRLLPDARRPRPAPAGPLSFIALMADPLVRDDKARSPRDGYKLDIEHEMQAIGKVLAASGVALAARRIPPTKAHLQSALRRGPAILHLSCHGNVIPVEVNGRRQARAILDLEDADGVADPLPGPTFTSLPPAGVLRLVVMSACRTAASAMDASLARSLVAAGIPAAIGMQGDFPDPLSDELAATLYEFLLAGHDLGEALRQARGPLAKAEHPYAVGLPVAYAAPGAAGPLPLQAGQPAVPDLTQGRYLNLPLSLQPPHPFLGRERELYELAHAFSAGHHVITVVGTGGIGKTALAAAFAERFGWRFAGGVVGFSLADLPDLAPESLVRALLERVIGVQATAALADRPAEALAEAFVAASRERSPLVLLDNYESVLQALGGASTETAGPSAAPLPDGAPRDALSAAPATDDSLRAHAERLHRLVAGLAQAGLPLLLTSRQQPAGLPGETVFPRDGALKGIADAAGAELFIHHSTRAQADPGLHAGLALQVAQVTEGHPLAIALLAGEFDASRQVTPAVFLAGWDEELAAARRPGLAAHQVTFDATFGRSFRALSETDRGRLADLSRFNLPFFAEGAACLWTGAVPADEAELAPFAAILDSFAGRSLVRVEGTFTGTDRAATYRLEPVIGRTLRRQRLAEREAALDRGYAAYARWLVDRAYGETGRDPGLARLVQGWGDELIAQAERQSDGDRARYCWLLGIMLRQFGRLADDERLQEIGKSAAIEQDNTELLARILAEQANVSVVYGDLTRALEGYQRSLVILEQVGDLQGKAATLHQMAQVYLTRGDLEQAMRLYQQSLALKEQVGDLQGKATTLHQMAQVYLTRGDLEQAMRLYQQSLALKEQVGDMKGKAATLANMAQVYLTRGDLEQALRLYQQSLALKEQVGDLQGKAATLHNMAGVYLTRGDLEQAMRLYQQSLALKEQVGDLQGKAATLASMAQVYLTRGDLEQAMRLYQQSLALEEQVGDLQGKAATLASMAQVYLTRGDLEQAMRLYQQSLALKEHMGDLQGKAIILIQMARIYLARFTHSATPRTYYGGALRAGKLDQNQQPPELLGAFDRSTQTQVDHGEAVFQPPRVAPLLQASSPSEVISRKPALEELVQAGELSDYALSAIDLVREAQAAKSLHASRSSYLKATDELTHAIETLSKLPSTSLRRSVLESLSAWQIVIQEAVGRLSLCPNLELALITRQLLHAKQTEVVIELVNTGGGIAQGVAVKIARAFGCLVLRSDRKQRISAISTDATCRLVFRVRPTDHTALLKFELLYSGSDGRPWAADPSFPLEFLSPASTAFVRVDRSPYVVASPIDPASGAPFVGRRDIFFWVQENLFGQLQPSPLVLYGQRRIGKTSALRQMAYGQAGRDFRENGFHKVYPVFVDMQGLSGYSMRALVEEFCSRIAQELDRQGIHVVLPCSHRFENSPSQAFNDFFATVESELSNTKGRILLMIDEFEALGVFVERGRIDPSIFEVLRYQMQNNPSIVFLIAGSYGLQAMTQDDRYPLFHSAKCRSIDFLTYDDTIELVRGPVSSIVRYDDLAVDEIWRATQGHPYFVQYLCQDIISSMNRRAQSNDISAREVRSAINSLINADSQAFAHLWNPCTPFEQDILVAVAGLLEGQDQSVDLSQVVRHMRKLNLVAPEQEVSRALEHLVNRNILRHNYFPSSSSAQRQYSYSFDLLRLWIARKQAPNKIQVKSEE